jgi:GNAT superfamily N-acetyltransferase
MDRQVCAAHKARGTLEASPFGKTGKHPIEELVTHLSDTPTWNDLVIRAAAPDEDAALVELMRLVYAHQGRPHPTTADQYRQMLHAPFFDPTLDRRVVSTADGTLAGYAHLTNRAAFTRLHPAVYVHPDYTGRGIGTYLTEWAEARARELIPRAPTAQPVILSCSISSTQTVAAELLTAHGYTLVRHFLDLQADLMTAPAPPVWPAQITLRTAIRGQDERAIYRVVDETFGDHWDHVHVEEEEGLARFVQRIEDNPQHDPTLWFLACVQDAAGQEEIVGYALCDLSGWINLVGVRRPWRRQGLAAALVQQCFGEFWRRGVQEVHLMVDGESPTRAVQLYVRAGMRKVYQADVYFKELRPAGAA